MEPGTVVAEADGCGKREEVAFRFGVGFVFGFDYNNSLTLAEPLQPLDLLLILAPKKENPHKHFKRIPQH